MKKKTIVINFTGGPGAGKSFMATRLVSNLKERGISCEYVPEFAKDLVWEGRTSELSDQLYVLANQAHNIKRLNDKVNVIITDSPIILSMYYNEFNKCFNSEDFNRIVLDTYKNYDNIVYFVERNHPYEQEGRYQTEEESELVSKRIKEILDSNNIKYRTITSSGQSAEEITDFIEKFLKLYEEEKPSIEYERKYLLKSKNILKLGLDKKHITQCYLDIGQSEKRIRCVDNKRYFFTEKRGTGPSRLEYEKEISREEYEYLRASYQKGKTIEKDRYYFNLEGTKACEINSFISPRPIKLIEVEFDNEESMRSFTPPKWFGKEVTNDANYLNYNIAVE